MADATPYVEDVAKYTSNVREDVVEALVKNLASILGNRDAMLVSCSDDAELDTVRRNFIEKKLGVNDDAAADEAMKAVCDKMSADRSKNRVTFYYLAAEALGKLDKLV